jgi:hypothetical protein
LFPKRTFFGSSRHLKGEPATAHAAYTTLLDHIRNLVMNSFEIPENLMTNLFIGTHLLRKTAYLLAMWGIGSTATDIDMANIGASARHTDIKSMAKYLRDSGTLEELRSRVFPNDPEMFVGRWKPIHIKTLLHWKTMNINVRPHTSSLAELSLWFVSYRANGRHTRDKQKETRCTNHRQRRRQQ